jgi:hypothetical protein
MLSSQHCGFLAEVGCAWWRAITLLGNPQKGRSMASKKQIKANRANARKSTGRKTDMGKLILRFNALKHGLTSQKMVTIPGESIDAYLEHLVEVTFEYDPQTAYQRQLVEQLANRLWGLRRVPAFEAGLFTVRYYETQMICGETPKSGDGGDKDDEDKEVRATGESCMYGLALARMETSELGKLSRHETTVLNSIKKMVKLLEESGCTAKSRH